MNWFCLISFGLCVGLYNWLKIAEKVVGFIAGFTKILKKIIMSELKQKNKGPVKGPYLFI